MSSVVSRGLGLTQLKSDCLHANSSLHLDACDGSAKAMTIDVRANESLPVVINSHGHKALSQPDAP